MGPRLSPTVATDDGARRGLVYYVSRMEFARDKLLRTTYVTKLPEMRKLLIENA